MFRKLIIYLDDPRYVAIYDRRKDWTDALRSGKYLQGTGTLVNHAEFGVQDEQYEYCCLGVACDVHADELNLVLQTNLFGPGFLNTDDKSILYSVLTDEALHFYGLTDEQQEILMTLNDGGVSFDIISDVIIQMKVHVEED